MTVMVLLAKDGESCARAVVEAIAATSRARQGPTVLETRVVLPTFASPSEAQGAFSFL
jgi:hypothetical protein